MYFENPHSYTTYTLAKELAAEFEKKYDFKERLSRVDLTQITEILNEFKLNHDLCKTIYILKLECKLTPSQTYNHLTWIMKIYEETGNPIPETPTHMFNFAAREGAWLQFLYGKFKYILDDKLRPLINAELSIESEVMPSLEKISDLLNSRHNIINNYIIPLIERWVVDHNNLNQVYAASAILSPIIKADPSEAYKKLIEAVNSTKKYFFNLDALTESIHPEEEIIKTKIQIVETRRSLFKPLNEMSSTALAQVLLQAIPRIKPEVNTVSSSNILIVHAPITRNGLVGPDFKSPIDFLERDVLLAGRRSKPERREFLLKTVTKVFKNMNYKTNNPLETAYNIINELLKRFDQPSLERKQLVKILYEDYDSQITEIKLNTVSEKELYDYLNIKHPLPHDHIIKKISEHLMKKLNIEGEE